MAAPAQGLNYLLEQRPHCHGNPLEYRHPSASSFTANDLLNNGYALLQSAALIVNLSLLRRHLSLARMPMVHAGFTLRARPALPA